MALLWSEPVKCPGGVVIDPQVFRAAASAHNALEAAHSAWAAELEDESLAAAWKAARKELTAQNKLVRGKPYPCGRCAGLDSPPGRIRAFAHICNGVCFQCEGRGWMPFGGFKAQTNPLTQARKRAQRKAERSEQLRLRTAELFERCPEALAVLIREANLDQIGTDTDGMIDTAVRCLRAAPAWYTLTARRRGRCAVCGEHQDAGETIAYDAARYEQYHVACAPTPEPWIADDAPLTEQEAFIREHVPDGWRDDIYRALGVECV